MCIDKGDLSACGRSVDDQCQVESGSSIYINVFSGRVGNDQVDKAGFEDVISTRSQ